MAQKNTASGARKANAIKVMGFNILFHQAACGSVGTSGCQATHVHRKMVDAQLTTMLGMSRQWLRSLQVAGDGTGDTDKTVVAGPMTREMIIVV